MESVITNDDVGDNGIGDEAALVIATKLKNLKRLFIGKNGLSEGCIIKIREHQPNCSLDI